jgi:hypothetical protein
MNERIRELARQSTDFVSHIPCVIDAEEAKTIYTTKFAELIVRECEHVVAVQLESEREPNDEWDRGYISGMWAATRYMKEHFGVEE